MSSLFNGSWDDLLDAIVFWYGNHEDDAEVIVGNYFEPVPGVEKLSPKLKLTVGDLRRMKMERERDNEDDRSI